ncbi:MAG: winged helix-turn-helix transcriptional regulator [Acidobacteria bacterium]|nr:winged helix-turn-helix domain-containing protein [Pyrinomonadaceae bacterium]MCC6453007.1 winged helix-turn-helix transcriptional regulator [Acidobacteriota bacterium]
MLTPREHKKLEKYVKGMDVRRMAAAFDALGEPNRCLIFRALLKHDNVIVSQIAAAVGISEPLASQHLKVLLNADLVERVKDGKRVYYTINLTDPLVNALKNVVEA